MLCVEPAEVWNLSRDSGFPSSEGTQSKVLEEGLFFPPPLWPLLLHQRLLKGQTGGVSVLESEPEESSPAELLECVCTSRNLDTCSMWPTWKV